jgi:hypothetical protein|tara:strand:+ start:671 stop:907 length:237 start_codon:yes stop_codon:yes gene_type:complete
LFVFLFDPLFHPWRLNGTFRRLCGGHPEQDEDEDDMVKEIDSEVLTKQPEGIRAKENEQIMLHSFFVRPFDLQRTGAM